MNDIHLLKPIVLRNSLDDVTEKQKKQAIRFLCNYDVLTVNKSSLEIRSYESVKGRLPSICFFGSEAVCIYRQTLGLPDISIRSIDVDRIVQNTFCFDHLIDILFFLHRVERRNMRFARLYSINAPAVIMMNEYRVLQEYVEYLQDNNWSGRPITYEYEEENRDGKLERRQEIRKSLVDIKYDLVAAKEE